MRTVKTALMCHRWKNPPHTRPCLHLTGWYCRPMHFSSSAEHQHREWVIDYSLNRHGSVRVADTGWQPRLPGIAHIYPPNTPYWEDTLTNRRKLQGGYVTFTGGEELGLQRYLQSGRYIRILDPEKRLAAPLQEIARAGHLHGDDGYWQALSAFLRLIDFLQGLIPHAAETFELPAAHKSPPEVGLPERLRCFLQAHLAEKITLRQLAEVLHTSASTLSHQHRKLTGLSPIQALIELRLNKVEALLRTDLTLDEIARQTGFYDAFHLSKTYKQCRGISPRHG